ncbi:MAG: M48 family metalloprotease [Steroidobacteraceae bacterium]
MKGFVRITEVRLEYGRTESGAANVTALTSGKAGVGRVSETAGVRGIEESDLQSAPFDQAQLDAMVGHRADEATASVYAINHGWQATKVAFDSELKPRPDKISVSSDSTSETGDVASEASGLISSIGDKFSSLLSTMKRVAPKSEKEQAAEELALGPQIAGRVLGARPLWQNADAQQRVNVVGRWVASQTSRPDLPWAFGVIDTGEINAFAAPGGYVMVTRGLYELLSSDSELAAVLGHEISHCVQRDQYNVIHKQEIATLGKETLSSKVGASGNLAESLARGYVEKHGATIVLTSLDREAEFRADKAAEIYLARSGMNPMALYSVLQKMTAVGEKSASLAALYKTHPPLDARLTQIDRRGYAGLGSFTTRE